MADKEKSVVSKGLSNVRKALREEGGQVIVGELTKAGVEMVPAHFIEFVLAHVNPWFLKNQGFQRSAARLSSAIFGAHSETAETVLMELFAKLAEKSTQFTGDKDKDVETLRQGLKEFQERASKGAQASVVPINFKHEPSVAQGAKGLMKKFLDELASEPDKLKVNLESAGNAAEDWAKQSAERRKSRKAV